MAIGDVMICAAYRSMGQIYGYKLMRLMRQANSFSSLMFKRKVL